MGLVGCQQSVSTQQLDASVVEPDDTESNSGLDIDTSEFDTADDDTESESETSPQWCVENDQTICDNGEEFDVSFNAEDIDRSMEFVAYSDGLLLARTVKNEVWEPVVIPEIFDDPSVQIRLRSTPAEMIDPIAVTTAAEPFSELVVLARDKERYRLYDVGQGIEGRHLRELPITNVGLFTEFLLLNGIFWDRWERRICVYGNSSACFDGEIWQVLPPTEELTAMARNSRQELLFVGHRGTIYFYSEEGWQQIDAPNDLNFRSVTMMNESFIAGAEDGRYYHGHLNGQAGTVCDFGDGDITAVQLTYGHESDRSFISVSDHQNLFFVLDIGTGCTSNFTSKKVLQLTDEIIGGTCWGVSVVTASVIYDYIAGCADH